MNREGRMLDSWNISTHGYFDPLKETELCQLFLLLSKSDLNFCVRGSLLRVRLTEVNGIGVE